MVTAVVADDHNPSGASAAVLLHGQPGDAHDWDAVVECLAGGSGAGSRASGRGAGGSGAEGSGAEGSGAGGSGAGGSGAGGSGAGGSGAGGSGAGGSGAEGSGAEGSGAGGSGAGGSGAGGSGAGGSGAGGRGAGGRGAGGRGAGGRGAGGRWRVVVPDRPGYGRTGGTAGGFADNAAAVAAMLDRLAIDRATIVGHSWAGGVALALALDHPERVQRLVLVSAVGGPGSIDRLDHLLGVPVLGPAMALGGLAVLRLSRVRRLLAPVHAPRDPAALETLPAGWLSSWRSFTLEQRALLEELPALAERVGGIGVPAVVIAGSADRVVSPASQQALALRLGAALVEVPGGGHLLPREAPDVVAEAVVGA